mmetsp:Transcript_79886/g.231882  ORF Transcript_79886/g.231882 Transcript_79886/m.231882 type:complete len:223 (-) Transcript_79886:349-1017(-)
MPDDVLDVAEHDLVARRPPDPVVAIQRRAQGRFHDGELLDVERDRLGVLPGCRQLDLEADLNVAVARPQDHGDVVWPSASTCDLSDDPADQLPESVLQRGVVVQRLLLEGHDSYRAHELILADVRVVHALRRARLGVVLLLSASVWQRLGAIGHHLHLGSRPRPAPWAAWRVAAIPHGPRPPLATRRRDVGRRLAPPGAPHAAADKRSQAEREEEHREAEGE